LIRRARLEGKSALWLPGTDHAGLATQTVVERELRKQKVHRRDLCREKFQDKVWAWREEKGGIILEQLRRLGASCDWDRTQFTMDPHYSRAVLTVFVDLFRKGNIYRGKRMVNWCPATQTALSDEEVIMKPVNGAMYRVRYERVDAPGQFVEVKTTRPESIPGDVAFAVHPEDPRYAEWIGKKVRRALGPAAEIPIIADAAVDREFGTGALKITPAHDKADFEIGGRHHLPIIDVLDANGTLNAFAGPELAGLDRFAGRKKAAELLKASGALIAEEAYANNVGYSERADVPIEPRLTWQWWLRYPRVEEAKAAVREGHIKFHPERWSKVYLHWLENIQDWCISRQLWWGQRIPAWYDADGRFVVAENENEAKKLFKQKFGTGDIELTQDDDVLDTWFSSWLWPMEVFKGITNPGNKEISYYYPTSVLVTGQDIIFFWVARMIMAGMEYKDVIPFEHVYFTGMVRDKMGRKMSKSLGNSPDLLELIEKYGADAVRFGIMISAPAGNDLLFDETSPEQGRFFNNKIWNALKLLKMWEQKLAGPGDEVADPSGQDALVVMDVSGFAGTVELEDNGDEHTQISRNDFAVRWFDAKLSEVREEVKKLYDDFKLSEALKTIYSLIWDDFCSWYLEWVKPQQDQRMDKGIYRQSVKFFTELMQMLHPFMPFVTEEIYHLLDERKDDLCVKQTKAIRQADSGILSAGMRLKEVITGLRDARNKSRIKQRDEIKLYIITENPDLYRSFYHILTKQVNANAIAFNTEAIGHNISLVIGKDKFFLETTAPIDNSGQRDDMMKELRHLEGFLSSVDRKLSNERFMQNARPEVVALEKKKRDDAETKIRVIRESLANL
jgi:valyl-tRNA synthetase